MKIEYEATFLNIDKEDFKNKLKNSGATLVYSEFLQKRVTFNIPPNIHRHTAWARVRQEFDKVTITYKDVSGGSIEGQQEVEIISNDFNESVLLLEKLGCVKKSYQETLREKWSLNGVEIVIDEWPFLEPFVEIEGDNENDVRQVSEILNFKWSDAVFDSVTFLYKKKYNISEDRINNNTPVIVFDMENPFV